MGSAAPLVLGAAGAIVGGIYGGPTGAQIGWAVGSSIGAQFQPAQKVQGPRLADLKVVGVEYGQPIPYVQGSMRVPGQVWWSSDRREIATTTNQDSGGKGGGPEVEQTTYTYEVDILFGLTDNEIAGVTRVWLNGKLVWTNLDSDFAGQLFIDGGGGGLLATAVANAAASLTASSNTMHWRRITVYTGDQDQQSDPTYEAAVGAENSPAYRDRGTVFIEGLQLGSSGQIPNLTFEVVTKATGGQSSVDTDVLLQCEFDEDSEDDISSFSMIDSISAYASVSNNTLKLPWVNSGLSQTASLTYSGGDIDNHAGASWTLEFYLFMGSGASGSSDLRIALITGTAVDCRLFIVRNSADGDYGKLYQRDSGAVNGQSDVACSFSQWVHIAWVQDITSDESRLYFDGVEVMSISGAAQGLPVNTGAVVFGGPASGAATSDIFLDDIRLTLGERYTAEFTPPERGSLENPVTSAGEVLSPLPEELHTVVSGLCERAGLTTSQYDVSGLNSSPQKTVRGMAITQVTSTRSVIEMLASAYFFEAHVRDKLYFVERGGASVATIDFEDMGATESDDPKETFELHQGNDIELPAQVSITYANYYDDYQNDTQMSDRLVSAVDKSVATVQLPLALTPSEAKAIADTMVLDQYVSLISSTVCILGTEGSEIEPTDIITPTDADDETYRMRVVGVLDNYPLLELECVLDNSVLLTSSGTTSTDYEPSIVVEEPPDAEMELLDIPILRDTDDDPGFYAAMKGAIANWPGGSLMKSIDNAEYSSVETFTESAVFGTTTTTLGDWSGGRLFDDINTVTVNVGNGTLSSSTRSAVLNDQSVNAMRVGDEMIQFVTATLVSSGVYTLSRLLRGCRGTESAMTGHAASEVAVLLRMAGLRRVDMQSSELGLSRYYAAVTFGRPLSSGLTGSPASGEAFTNTGKGLRPFNPVYLRFNRETNGDITITGQRRSRLAVRMIGSLGINVPDDDTTSWLLDILSNEGSPQTVYRTLTGTVSGTEITWTYSAANQATDFGSPTPTQISVGGYGFSSTVGRSVGTFKTGAV